MDFLEDKVIIVTGGAGLLGKEFVKGIVKVGGVAIIADIDKKFVTKVISEISKELGTNDNIDFVELDITSKKSINEALEFLMNKYPKIDALVNNAYPRNKNYGYSFFDVEYNDFVENVGMHLGGYFLTSQQFAKYFLKQGFGNIINIASIYGVIPPRFEIYEGTKMTTPVEYAVIKSALIHLTKYMAKYFKGKNIRVNSISPGGIFDNQPKNFIEKYNSFGLSKGILDKSDIVGTLTFLLSDMSKYINGQNIIVDDGVTL